MLYKKSLFVLLTSISLITFSCKKETETMPVKLVNAISTFGEVTSAVVIVNPIINKGSTTTVTTGTQRNEVSVQAANLPVVKTDVSGLALVQALPTGTIPLKFPTGDISLNVVNEKELYDVVVAVRDNGVQEVISAIRYPIGGNVLVLSPGQSITQAASVDNAIIFLKEGVYPGDVEVRGTGVLIFGAWSPLDGQLSVIDGNLTVMGGSTRVRGIKVTQKITASANSFSAAFCLFNNATITGNANSLIRNSFTGSQVSVPSSNAVLVDNTGIL